MDDTSIYGIHENHLRAVVSKFEEIFKTAKPCEPVDLQNYESLVLTMDGIVLAGNSLAAYFETIERLLRIQWVEEFFSRDFLKEQVLQIIRKERSNFDQGTLNPVQAIRSFLSSITGFIEAWRVVVPVTGIDLDGVEEFRIGNVVFTKLVGANPFLRLAKKITSTNEILTREYIAPLENKTVAVVDEKGEPQRAREKGISTVEEALNVLRFYSTFFFEAQESRINVGLKPRLEIWNSLCIQKDRGELSPFKIPQFIPPFYFTIDNKTLRVMNKKSFGILNQILRSSDRTVMEKQILNALRWFGIAREIEDAATKFVSYYIALDMLLGKKSRRSTGEIIGETVALLLSDDIRGRRRIKRDQDKLSEIRKNIVHDGDWKDEYRIHLAQIEKTAREVILTLLQRTDKLKTKEDLGGWIQNRRFSGRAFAASKKS
jgi:hypothetical protein